jgi:hypothetical protein
MFWRRWRTLEDPWLVSTLAFVRFMSALLTVRSAGALNLGDRQRLCPIPW